MPGQPVCEPKKDADENLDPKKPTWQFKAPVSESAIAAMSTKKFTGETNKKLCWIGNMFAS